MASSLAATPRAATRLHELVKTEKEGKGLQGRVPIMVGRIYRLHPDAWGTQRASIITRSMIRSNKASASKG